MVSAFYQEIAILVQDDQRLKDIVYSIWKRGDLAIIKDILLPIETIAIQIAKGDRIEPKTTKGHNLKRNRLPAVMQAMYDLYRYAPE
jgi:hypothetical protein